MKATLLTFWEDVRSSYWFIPSLMALAAVFLSSGAIYLDGMIGSSWMDQIPWLYANKPDGARALLSTISGSMITGGGRDVLHHHRLGRLCDGGSSGRAC